MKSLAAAVLALAMLTALPAPSEAAETCQGLPATLVGSPDTVLRGTAGNDVIVSNGASEVLAAAGDDLVCATGSTHRLDAGLGNDAVDTTASTRYVRTTLGEGDDEFVGGPGRDWVMAGTVDASGTKVDTGVDEIDTNDGGGLVHTGAGAAENSDDVSFGTAGPGEVNDVVFEGVQSFYYGDVDLGEGRTRLFLATIEQDTASVGLRVGGQFLEDGVQRMYLPGADRVYLTYGRLGDLRVWGSPADEQIELRGRSVARPDVSMGGGDDLVVFGTCPGGPADGMVDGGTGLDTVRVGFSASCRDLDLTLDGDLSADGDRTATMRRIENLAARARHVTLTGNFHDNGLVAYGCRVSLRGGAGADSLHAARRNNCATRAELAGGPGPDRLVGSPSTDLLVGGPNRDVAVGRGGTDTCRAEVEKGCEQ